MNEMGRAIVAREFLENAAQDLADYVVGFAKFYEENGVEDAKLGGSGTLVSVEGNNAILTADHVLDNLPDTGMVGLILPTRFQAQLHRVTLDMDQATKVRIARGEILSEGPDLGALLLPASTVSIVQSIKGFYNLSKRQKLFSIEPNIDLGVWVLCGMAHEWTSETTPEHGYQRVKLFRGVYGGGIVSNQRNVNDFDYINFETKYEGIYEGPQSYEGFSGGGLWQLIISKTSAGDLIIEDNILSGVAFYQTTLVENRRSIICHSRKSIYRSAVDTIRKNS
jgi:hypothetical protein